MKINIELNQKSIKDAIKLLKNQKKVINEQMLPEYMQKSADWIINRANEILDRSDIGEDVKSQIFNSWDTVWVNKNCLKIINYSWKSAFVEFGVGIIAQTSKHPNADNTGYEYNVDSDKKFGQGFWQFSVSDKDQLDIPQKSIIYQDYDGEQLSIITQGTQGVWFLFNAVEDFKVTYQQRLWEQVKKKYWS